MQVKDFSHCIYYWQHLPMLAKIPVNQVNYNFYSLVKCQESVSFGLSVHDSMN